MADLRKETHGANSMKAVDLVVIAYDNRVAKKDGAITTHYLDLRIHPEDRRGPGQISLALVSKPDTKAPSGFNNTERYSVGQFDAIKAAAGDNVADLTNQAGVSVGKIYGVKADLLISGSSLIANTKTVEESKLSVLDNEAGTDIRTRMFDSMKAAKAARAATAAVEAPEAGEAAVETPAVDAAEAAVEAPAEAAAKPKAARKPSTRKPAAAKAPKPELVSAGVSDTQASSEEPGLG